jgi:transcriptional regulator with XRE-family HTH domain
MKTEERELAMRLRREEGLSVREVAVAVGVSRGTASRWLRDIPLSPVQRAALDLRNPSIHGHMNGAKANAELARDRRREYQERGRRRVAAGDVSFIAACALYWGEGEKDRACARLSNSDPAMLRYFLDAMRASFAIDDDSVRVRLHVFADHEARIREIEAFWLETLGLRRKSLTAPVINRYSRASQRKRIGRLPYGTCRVAICRTAIVQELFGGIQELAGADHPEWLG